MVIRPASTLVDLWVVRQLQDKGISLDLDEGGEAKNAPLRRAFFALFFSPLAEDKIATYVMRRVSGGQLLQGFLQTRRDPEREGVQVIYISPSFLHDDNAALIWQDLLEYTCLRLGSQGVRRLFANLEEGEEEEVFRKAGFIPYAREEVFYLDALPDRLPEPLHWRPQRKEDSWGVRRLYNLVTPPLVQQAEDLSFSPSQGAVPIRLSRAKVEGWVWEEKGEILAYLPVREENKLCQMRLFLHPSLLSKVEEVLGEALALMADDSCSALIFRVRNYEGGVKGALEAFGFRPLTSRSLLVRHTLAVERKGAVKLLRVLDNAAGVVNTSVSYDVKRL